MTDLRAGKPDGGVGQQIFFWSGMAVTVFVTLFITRLARNALREAAPSESHQEIAPAEEGSHV